MANITMVSTYFTRIIGPLFFERTLDHLTGRRTFRITIR